MHLEPELLDRLPVSYHCGCTREKVEKTLMSLGEKELGEMIAEQNGAEVDCHFCNTRRRFSADDLRSLIERIQSEKQRTAEAEQ